MFGKSEVQIVFLNLWRDEDVPELDVINHLLPFLYITGIKKGFIFPNDAKLLSIMVLIFYIRSIPKPLTAILKKVKNTVIRSIIKTLNRLLKL